MAEPYPKSRQLARGERRYRRKIASPKQWQAIIAGKGNECRVCGPKPHPDARGWDDVIQYHHLIARSLGGDDVAENIVPLCAYHHESITLRVQPVLRWLAEQLTDAEYAYVVGKLGEDGMQRIFGV